MSHRSSPSPRFTILGFLLAMILACCGSEWTPLARGGPNHICYGSGTFVSVGRFGNVLWSTDGHRWWGASPALTGSYEEVYSVCYGNNQFFYVGRYGVMARSVDGKMWTKVTSPTTDDLKDVTYANGKYMAVGDGPSIYSSPDGINWSGPLYTDSGPYPPISGLSCVSYGNGVWVAMDDGNTRAVRSVNGTSWARVNISAAYKEAMIHDGNRFITVGDGSAQSTVTRSLDGLTWESTPAPENLRKIAHQGGTYVALGYSGKLYLSTDLTTWTATTAETDLTALTFGGGLFCAVGNRQTATSPDGITWTIRTPSIAGNLTALCWYKDKFITVGYDGYIEHYNWRTGIRTPVPSPGTERLNSIATDGNRCVATSEEGYFYLSPDGTNWTRTLPQQPPPPASSPLGLLKVRHVLGSFVAMGTSYSLRVSADGINWSFLPTAGAAPYDRYFSIASNGTYALLVGSDGRVRHTTNLVTWNPRPVAPETFYDIAYGNGAFIAVSGFNGLYRSVDGTVWTPVFSLEPNASGEVIFENGKFLVWTSEGHIYTSTNGLTWKEEFPGAYASGYTKDFAYGDGVFASADGLISSRLPGTDIPWSLAIEPGRQFALRANPSAAYGSLFRVEHSSNLSAWQVIRRDLTPAPDGTLFRESIPEGTAKGFYRAVPVE